MALLQTLTQEWRSRLDQTCGNQPEAVQLSIIQWLLGENPERLQDMEPSSLKLVLGGMNYRFRILTERYLLASPDKGYQLLLRRLASVTQIRNKVTALIEQSRDRQRTVINLLEEVIQEMLEGDRYLQQQCAWIYHCTHLPQLRTALLFTCIEEYGLRPVANQSLIVCRIFNHLKRSQRGGVTQVPSREIIHLLSEQVSGAEDDVLHLSDREAIVQYEDEQSALDLNVQRRKVQQDFELYLAQELGEMAIEWFRLYLQGYAQETIAQKLKVPIKQVYRLREKVSYHAIRIFGLRVQPQLVAEWLGTSLQNHSLGLTPTQWAIYWETLTPPQQLILEQLKDGATFETIAKSQGMTVNQVTAEWGRLYLAAQHLRSE